MLLISQSIVSDSLQPHGQQHTRLSCPLPSLGVYSDSSSLSQWCHPIISSSVTPFSWPQSFPASGSFPMNQPFVSGGHSIWIWASDSASVLPVISCFSFVFISMTLGGESKKIFLWLMWKDVLLMFSSWIFIISCLTFRP